MKTRFAPSPTGFLHIGTARTALFNYLLAKKNKGSFVLRIEDTDRERSEKRFKEDIIETLDWLNIKWDEGPYNQSERGEVYEKYLKKLLEENKAYYCFCSKEKLEAKKQSRVSNGLPPKYDGECSRLKKEEVEERLSRGEDSVIRLRIPEEKIETKDLIRGKITFDAGLIGDIVIARSLKEPLYNFSVVIDDFEMEITHVIRGEDLLSNTPKQIILSRYLGFAPPKYGHLPMILGPDKSKLSKRHGASAVSDYRREGYLPEAIINFLALLGWSPKDNREFFTIPELIKEFEVEKVNKSNAIFNYKKLDYVNGYYIRKKPLEEITSLCVPYLKEYITLHFKNREVLPNLTGIMGRKIEPSFIISKTGEEISFAHLQKIISLYKERMKKLSEITELTDYFFKKELVYDKEILKWKDMDYKDISSVLKDLLDLIKNIKEWNIESLEGKILSFSSEKGDRGRVLWPFRAAITGKRSSAGPFEVAEALGKEKTIERIEKAIILCK